MSPGFKNKILAITLHLQNNCYLTTENILEIPEFSVFFACLRIQIYIEIKNNRSITMTPQKKRIDNPRLSVACQFQKLDIVPMLFL